MQGDSVATGAQKQDRAESSPVHVLPLYAMLPGAAQAAVFSGVPAGHRLIVVATNVAETSLTIPGMLAWPCAHFPLAILIVLSHQASQMFVGLFSL